MAQYQLTQEERQSYDQMLDGYMSEDVNWQNAAYFVVGAIESIMDSSELSPQGKVMRVKYVLARFNERRGGAVEE